MTLQDDSVVSRRRQQSNMETDQQLTHRQRSRMADLSLLLEKILGASGHTLKKELLRCGLLSRLQFCAINNYGMGYTSSLRKICRAVQALPITTSTCYVFYLMNQTTVTALSIVPRLPLNQCPQLRKTHLLDLEFQKPGTNIQC